TVRVGEQPGDVSAQLVQAAAAGADAVFLAMRGPQARALVPQLALAGLGAKTRVATSQLISGTGRAEEDAVLDGTVYPTAAWPVRGAAQLPSAQRAAELVPTARGPAARLFAFGYDAWRISAYLERLATRADGALRGATATLRLDGFGAVLRPPAWATSRGGTRCRGATDGHGAAAGRPPPGHRPHARRGGRGRGPRPPGARRPAHPGQQRRQPRRRAGPGDARTRRRGRHRGVRRGALPRRPRLRRRPGFGGRGQAAPAGP